MGIEPTWPAWKAGALPLSYTRTANNTKVWPRIVNYDGAREPERTRKGVIVSPPCRTTGAGRAGLSSARRENAKPTDFNQRVLFGLRLPH